MSTVTISTKAAELIHVWIKDMMTKLHMIPNGPEYKAFIELHGAIEDSHYEDKKGQMSYGVVAEKINPYDAGQKK